MNDIDYTITQKAKQILALISRDEKAEPKSVRRLVRIRRNFFREMYALNKELKRHKDKSKSEDR